HRVNRLIQIPSSKPNRRARWLVLRISALRPSDFPSSIPRQHAWLNTPCLLRNQLAAVIESQLQYPGELVLRPPSCWQQSPGSCAQSFNQIRYRTMVPTDQSSLSVLLRLQILSQARVVLVVEMVIDFQIQGFAQRSQREARTAALLGIGGRDERIDG